MNTKALQDWYGEQEYKEALKEWIKQMGGITEFAKRAHCLTVTDTRARDVFIQTPQHAEAESVAAHEAKVQANSFDEKFEELRSKITTQESKITTQESQIVHLEERLRELTHTVLALQNIIETRAINAASEDEASSLADQVLAAYDAAPAASDDGPEIEEIE